MRNFDKKRGMFFSVLIIMIMIMFCEVLTASESSGKVIEDAVLYTLDEDLELEYNTLYEGKVSSEVKVSGWDVDSLQELTEIMGSADSPKLQVGTQVRNRTLGKLVIADLVYNSDDKITQIDVESVSERPVVGISWRNNSIRTDYQRFAEIFERNGAYVVYLPQVRNEREAKEIADDVNGIFFPGGEGWMPKFYNDVQAVHGSNEWNDERDISDLYLMKQAISMDIPLLAICRNAQGMNIALGGGVIQDVPYYLGKKVLNGEISTNRVTNVISGELESIGENVIDEGYPMYDSELGDFVDTYDEETGEYLEKSGCKEGHLRVEIDGLEHRRSGVAHALEKGVDKDSKWLYSIFKSETIAQVSSSHHQAIDPERLGDGLTVVAKSSDGIIEAIEYQENLFALGLQWHPEKFLLKSELGIDQELCNLPMSALVKYARIHNNREQLKEYQFIEKATSREYSKTLCVFSCAGRCPIIKKTKTGKNVLHSSLHYFLNCTACCFRDYFACSSASVTVVMSQTSAGP